MNYRVADWTYTIQKGMSSPTNQEQSIYLMCTEKQPTILLSLEYLQQSLRVVIMLEQKCFLGDLDNLYLLRNGWKYILILPGQESAQRNDGS